MAYPPYPRQPPQQRPSTGKQLLNIVILIVLIVVLLVVLTKFRFIHPRDIPGWQGFYCTAIEQKHSKIAIIYGDDGMGDPEKLENLIAHARLTTTPERVPVSYLSSGMLKSYDVIFLDRMQSITFAQSAALQSYMDGGGNVVWIGDAASKYTLTAEDLADALARNATQPGYYEKLLKKANSSLGFGELSLYLGVSYIRSDQGDTGLTLRIIDSSNLIGSGVGQAPDESKPGAAKELPLGQMRPDLPFAVVNEKAIGQLSGSTKVAVLQQGSLQYPAIIDIKYVGRLVYISFPPELIADQVTGLLGNIIDYLITC